MKKITLFLLLLLFSIRQLQAADGFTGNLLFTARLDSAHEVPSVASPGFGVASFILNSTRDTMCIKVSTGGLTGSLSDAFIYEMRDSSADTIAVTLSSFINGNTLSGMVTSPYLNTAVITKMLNGAYYINLSTLTNPAGEIRGPIKLETDYMLTASFNGAQEVPGVTTDGYGLAVFNLYQDSVAVIIDAKFENLSSPITAAFLQLGAAGTTGAVLDSLSGSVTGNTLHVEVDPRAYITDLLSGNVYLNVYTASNPNGEIRGQVLWDNKLAFDVFPNGPEEVPPTSSTATGVGYIKISNTLDTVFYDIIFDSLTTSPTLAHLHGGPPGVSGNVLVTLTTGLTENRDSGIVTGTTLDDLIIAMLQGDVYFNVHSSTYPNGEIRGQVGRYAREGLTYAINAFQETPPTTSTATGSGYASVDRFRENVHFMLVVSGLTGPVISSHFHHAPAGSPGPVIFTLDSFLVQAGNDAMISGFWTDDDSLVPFDSTYAEMFFNDSMYVNLHTNLFGAGEVRGQVIHGGDCFLTITGIQNSAMHGNFSIYPNPVNNELFFTLSSVNAEHAEVLLTDLAGRTLINKELRLAAGENKNSIDVTSLTPGIYLIRLNADGAASTVAEFIKE